MRGLLPLALISMFACGSKPNATSAPTSSECTATVMRSITAAFPGATTKSCKPEVEDGQSQFEVKLARPEGNADVDVAPNGTILQIEEQVAVGALPPVVSAGFAAKYPTIQPTGAQKQTRPGKGVFFEIAFAGPAGNKEATFDDKGVFVEEE